MNNANALIRQGIRLAARSLDQAQQASARPPAFTYVPPTHARALDPDATLVEGIRGSGKSFWWALLASETHRTFVRDCFPEARLPDKLEIGQGFGTGLSIKKAPDAETLGALAERYRPRSIWRAVLAMHAGFQGEFAKKENWEERVAWVQRNPENFADELERADARLDERSAGKLVLFDALDRLADDWQHIKPLAKGLLQVALEMRSTKRIRCKVYLRPDILQDESITGFPDFSKLLAGKASLEWRRADLYALLYQCLGNSGDGSAEFRALVKKILPRSAATTMTFSTPWQVPLLLRVDEKMQECLFELLAGKAMGNSTKRGKPYTWLVNHLQDGLNQVSPRSYFAALGTAVDETSPDYELPIDYRGIQRGVQKASAIRVKEITEDYAWVKFVMEPLRGNLTVPCTAREIETIWKRDRTLSTLESQLRAQDEFAKLPPQRLDQGASGILQDLQDLGMLQQIEDKRIQMPDVFRVAFGMGRRGGVKPLK